VSALEHIHAKQQHAAEAPSPTQRILDRTARLLRQSALINGGIALVILLLGGLAGTGVIPRLFDVLEPVVLNGWATFGAASPTASGADAAVSAAALITLLNMSLLLVIMVGILAREAWSLPALVILAIANGIAMIVVGYFPGVITIGAAALGVYTLLRDPAAMRRAFRANPVTIKELRGRMRGVRAFVVLTVYLGLMGGFAMLLYLVYSSVGRDVNSAAAGEIGRVLFNGVFAVELLLIIFIAPAFTAGAITGERERQTYDLLQTTLLSPASFVIGKLESALGYIVLLLAAGIPLQSLAFLFGGVSETELILSLLILFITAVTLGTVGIYFSAGQQRTLTASVRAYSTTLVAMFVAPALATIVIGITRDFFFTSTRMFNSPILEAILVYVNHLLISVNPLATAIVSQNLLVNQQIAGFYGSTLVSSGSSIPLASPWINMTIIYTAISALLITQALRAATHTAPDDDAPARAKPTTAESPAE